MEVAIISLWFLCVVFELAYIQVCEKEIKFKDNLGVVLRCLVVYEALST
jgi:hypothetical protein